MISLSLFLISCSHPVAQSPQAIIRIDTSQSTPISPYVYGVNGTDFEKDRVPFTLARQGGNRMTAYNWETNASNAGSDYRNQNDGYMGESNEPGWTVRTFLEAAQQHGAAAILTVPTAGYVSADKKGDGDVNQTPDYIHSRFLRSFAKKPGPFTYPPDITDKAVYQDEFVAWIEKIKSPKTPVWFMLDNEPDLWGSTHSRIWPKNPTYAQIIANNIEFASAIKAVAPDALVFGPANYGWNGFHTFQNATDANGRDFLDTYLDAMKAAQASQGKRLLDVLDVHFYPEARGGGVRVTDDSEKPETAAARIQAPRSLWDPTYVEDSWIAQATNNKPIVLIPTIEKQIADHYPKTKFSISEYNYGGGKSISGAIAQADVLGIYGRYGLFAACNWGVSPTDTGILAGYRAFLDFDGSGGRFGDRGLSVTGENPARDSVYASFDSKAPDRMTIVAINKTALPRILHIITGAFHSSSITSYTVDAANLDHPKNGSVGASGDSFDAQLPPMSVTTYDLRRLNPGDGQGAVHE